MPEREVIIISGPTASGKSALALKIASEKNGAIINADALQQYQGLPILSAQPGKEDLQKVPHYLYSILSPSDKSSAANWLDLAKQSIEEAWQNNQLPIVVGGTGMYLSKLIEGINRIPEISQENKERAILTYQEIGLDGLKEKLPQTKAIDKQRLIRAYEVLLETGKPIEYWHSQQKHKVLPNCKFNHLNLRPEREELYNNCNQRFSVMLKQGALTEVEKLVNDHQITDDLAIAKTLGFMEIKQYLSGKISKDEMINTTSQKTRNYAKRQLTWFRNQFADKLIISQVSDFKGLIF